MEDCLKMEADKKEYERVISKAVITDANILIDYCNVNKNILKIFASVYEVYVPLPVLAEVNNLTEKEAPRLGIKLLDTSFENITMAMSLDIKCSLEDKICFITAKNDGYICATNDNKLRNECVRADIEVLWGLEIMLILVKNKHLSKKEAIETAEMIGVRNKQISKNIIEEFVRLLKI
jgi:rRNA-processing protein FCF1